MSCALTPRNQHLVSLRTRFKFWLMMGCCLASVAPLSAQVINEFVANHTGTDDHEYVEVFGDPDTDYSDLWVVQIEGDQSDQPGFIDSAVQLGTTNAEGLWTTGFQTNVYHNGNMTLLLVRQFNGMVGSDIDTNNDGTLDSMPWNSIIDGIAVGSNNPGFTYTPVVLTPNFDGITFTPGGASRIPNGQDNDVVGDWQRNDFHGAGLPGFSGSLVPPEAANTPLAINSTVAQPPPGGVTPHISEFVANHDGTNDREFIEIWGEGGVSYGAFRVLVIEGDSGENPGQIDAVFQPGNTSIAGFWDTGFLTDALENGSLTLLLVEGFNGAQGDDLDSDDDGSFDAIPPWTALIDDVSLTDLGISDIAYSASVVGQQSRGVGVSTGGASRFPYGLDSDAASDWIPNNFQGATLGSMEVLGPGEAYNTIGTVNLIGVQDYYVPVNLTNATTLRNTLHQVVDDHIRFPYSSSFTDTWDILEIADQDPVAAGEILDIYRNASYTKAGGGNSNYNREHSWPSSYGFPDDGNRVYPYTDTHHLFLCNIGYNSNRGNSAFGDCSASCAEHPTQLNNGTGGGSGVFPGNSNWSSGSGGNGVWQVWADRKGDIARAQLYMDIRYEGGTHSFTSAGEPDLILTDNTSLINTTGSTTTGSAYMGRLATLLQWHQDDPVTEEERRRNDVVYQFQGNRNPFVDHPEYVDCLFNDQCGQVGPGCLPDQFPEWTVAASLCSAQPSMTVLDFVALYNGSCNCP